MVKGTVGYKICIALVATVGLVQAGLISTNSSQFSKVGDIDYNTNWQDIKSVTCAWNDADNDKILEIGEQVTFTVTMEKKYWGTHNYDALKTWIDNAPTISAPYLDTKSFIWDYNAGVYDYTNGSKYSYKPWMRGTKSFDVVYTFNQAGQYDFGASVMCSADLSNLVSSGTWDNPNQADWNAWGPLQNRYQGETEFWRLSVSKNVPEPGSLSLIFMGLMSLTGALFIRRKKQ
jgi:hypothetical protein